MVDREDGMVSTAIRGACLVIHDLKNAVHSSELKNLLHWGRGVHQPDCAIPVAGRLVQRDQGAQAATVNEVGF